MTTDFIWQIAQWLVPAGGLGAVAVWLTSWVIRNTRTAKEVHDTYKTMYEDIQGTLIELQNENKKLYKAVSKLERAVSKATTCRYFADCPMRGELQEQTDGTNDYRPLRQPGPRKKNRRMARDNPPKQGEPESADGQCI